MKVRKLLALALSLLMIVATIPATTFAATAADITLYPVDGYSYYEDDTMDFVATVPTGATGVTFAIDGVDMGTPIANGTSYTLSYDTENLYNGEHTFTVNATVDGAVLTKSSTFDFYCYDNILVNNDFEGISDSPTVAEISNADNIVPGLVSYGWANDAPTVSKTTGADGVGDAIRFTTNKSSGYPSFIINLNKVPYGDGYLGRSGGIKSGVFKTEFDLKVNNNITISLLGAGTTDTNNIATSTGHAYISSSSGQVAYGSSVYHNADWKHYEYIVDYFDGRLTVIVDGVVCYEARPTLYGFGNKSETGIQIQSNGSGATDFELDNFKISHNAKIVGAKASMKNFTGVAPSGWMYFDNICINNGGNATSVTTMEGPGGTGDVAAKIVNDRAAADYMNLRLYPTSNGFASGTQVTQGIFKFGIDLYSGGGGNFKFKVGSGTGFTSWTALADCEKDAWNHFELVGNLSTDTAQLYMNNKLVANYTNYTGNLGQLDGSATYIQFFFNNADVSGQYVGIDNVYYDVIDPVEVKGVSIKSADDASYSALSSDVAPYDTNSIKLSLSKAFTAVTASDIEVKAGTKSVAIASAMQDGTDLIINLASNLGSGRDVTVTVKESAFVSASTKLARPTTVKFETTEDPALKPWKQHESILVYNDFESYPEGITENASNTNARPASPYNYGISTWTVNNGMMMQKVSGADGNGLRFYATSSTGYPGAHFSLDQYLWGSTYWNTGLTADQAAVAAQGKKDGILLTEFDVKFDCDGTILSILGVGATKDGNIATSTYDSRLIEDDNELGHDSGMTFEKGEWGKISVLSNMRDGQCVYSYNGKKFMTVSAPYGFGLHDVFGRKGIYFQAYGGTVDFTIDNFKITQYTDNFYDFGTIDFEGLKDGATTADVKALLAPTVYKSINGIDYSNGLSASLVKAVEGPAGAGDTAFSFAPTQEHSGLRVYHLNNPFRQTRLGQLNASFDLKFTGTNLALGISGGFGENWGDNQFTNANCPSGEWHHIDVVSDFPTNTRVIYIDGEEVSRGGLKETLFSAGVGSNIDSNYLEFQARGYSASHPESSIAIDNLSYHYISRPGFGYFTVTENATNKTATAKMDSWFTDSAKYHEVIVASYITSDDGSLELDKVTLVPCDGAVGTINKTKATITEISDNKTVIKAFLWGEDQTPIEMIEK